MDNNGVKSVFFVGGDFEKLLFETSIFYARAGFQVWYISYSPFEKIPEDINIPEKDVLKLITCMLTLFKDSMDLFQRFTYYHQNLHCLRDTLRDTPIWDTLYIEMNNVGGNSQYNMIGVNLQVNGMKIIAFYRPPSFNEKEFLEILEEILHYEKNTLIIRDFNINLLDNTETVKEYKNCVVLNGFEIRNNIGMEYATRITQHSQTIIDHVLATSDVGYCKINIEYSTLSDHNLLEIEFYTKTKNNICKIQKTFERLRTSGPINTLTLIKLIQEAKSKATKIIKMKIRENNDWITPQFLELLKRRDELYKLWKKFPLDQQILWDFRNIKNQVEKEKKNLKQIFSEKDGMILMEIQRNSGTL